MSFGLFLPYQVVDAPSDKEPPLYQEMLQQAQLADSLGFDRIWTPEHHLTHYLQAPSALMTAVQVGLHVNCRVGTMVVVLPYHHPLRVAGEIAVADQILDGRFEVGLGRGSYAYEFRRLGLDVERSGDRFVESLEVLMKVWASETGVAHKGEFFTFDNASIWPKPMQRPHPPVWIAGRSESTIEVAARNGFNLATWPVTGPDAIVEQAIDTFRSAIAATGGGLDGRSQEFGVMRMAYAASNEADAARVTDVILANHRIGRRLHHDWVGNIDNVGYVRPDPVEIEPSLDEMMTNLFVGTADRCLDKLWSYERFGVDHLILQLSFGLSHEETMESIERFALEVIAPYRTAHIPEEIER